MTRQEKAIKDMEEMIEDYKWRHSMKANVLYLSHGRKNPSDDLDDWGEEGPQLLIHGMHITYGCTYIVSPHNTELTVREGCIYYDRMWYGDWGVFPLTADNIVETVPFDPVLAEPR